MKSDLCELQVLVHGKPVREYPHDGRLYIEGRKNTDFVLRVKNLTHFRLLTVISIDGLSIITGKEARTDDSGYVIAPRQSFSIPGWSLSDSEVARFFFHKAAESYAAKSGTPRNIGVIGCAVFREKLRPRDPILRTTTLLSADPVYDCYPESESTMKGGPVTTVCNASADSMTSGEIRPDSSVFFNSDSEPTRYRHTVETTEVERGPTRRRKSASKKRAIAEMAPSEIGTGFGKRQGFRVQEISFDRESPTPNEVLEITYDTRKGLEKRGVDLNWRPTVGRPDPFPGDKHCKPPADWQG